MPHRHALSRKHQRRTALAAGLFGLGALCALWFVSIISNGLTAPVTAFAGGGAVAVGAALYLVTARCRAEARQMAPEIGIERLMAASPVPLILVAGTSCTVITANAAAKTLFDLPADGRIAPHTKLDTLMDAVNLSGVLESVMATGLAKTIHFKRDGMSGYTFEARISPLGAETVLVFLEDMSMAYRLDKMRSDFIANVSHELRTPLTAIIGYVETLQGHARGDEAVRDKFLGMMHSQARRMLRLVRDLMSLSKIELDESRAPTETVNLSEIVGEVIDSLQPVTEHYNGVIRVMSPDEGTGQLPLDIIGVRDEVIQVIQNLLDNALKYAGDAPEVEVTVGTGLAPSLGEGSLRTGERAALVEGQTAIPADTLIYVQIKDNGRGVNRADLPRLTERFYRVNVEKSRLRGGTGLGLAIVKHVINRHRGALQIETLDGVGTAFTCYFNPAGQNQEMMQTV